MSAAASPLKLRGGFRSSKECGYKALGAGEERTRWARRRDRFSTTIRWSWPVRAPFAAEAAAQLRRELPAFDYTVVIVFISPHYDAGEFAAALVREFGDAPVYGCTTAGEIGPDGISEGGALAIAFRARDFTMVAKPILDIGAATLEALRGDLSGARAELEAVAAGRNRFALLLVDGLRLHEETLASTIGACLHDIQVVGGSAGDGMDFGVTSIICGGKASTNSAVLMLFSTDLAVRLFKCNSFEPTTTKLVVTDADIDRRIVRELNAEPAAREYARTIGLPESELNAYVFAAHPVIVRVGGDFYARSIQRANPDGSLTFFCAIDEGLVLTAAGRLDTLGVVEQMFADTERELGEVSAYIGFDCLHRRLDAEQRQIIRDLEDLYRRHRVVGFNTYGEQFESMHLNQTFSGVAIDKRPAAR